MNKLEENHLATTPAGDGQVIVFGSCFVTREYYQTPPFPAVELQRYLEGTLAQDALVSLDADNREFLISGTSPAGWDRLMKDM